jgi:altronate dehydratase small subunit
MTTVQLSPEDNVVVLTRSMATGESIEVNSVTYTLKQPLGLGHKVAARKISLGEKILKYGVPIGSAIRDIAPGEHVHLHDMKSDYLPTYTLEEGREFHHAS